MGPGVSLRLVSVVIALVGSHPGDLLFDQTGQFGQEARCRDRPDAPPCRKGWAAEFQTIPNASFQTTGIE